MLKSILLSMRPKQWTKNLIVFTGILFTLDKIHTSRDYLDIILTFLLFCVISGVVYIINDIKDLENDKLHPKKCKRPIASGKLPVPAAIITAAVLGPASLFLAFKIGNRVGFDALAYMALTLSYTFILKGIVLLDIMAIAAGFVLRAVAGADAIGVEISEWLLICTTLLALFLAMTKRRHEISSLADGGVNHRKVLDHYSLALLA